MKLSARGFTLVEILVVIAIIGILGTAGYVNYRAFSYEQIMDDGVNRIQSILRQAQTSATASIKCKEVGSTKWLAEFKNATTVDLSCVRADNAQVEQIKREPLTTSIRINSIWGNASCPEGRVCAQSLCYSSFPTNPMTVSFDTLSGKVSFSDQDPFKICISRLNNLVISITHTSSASLQKNITVGKGGGINAQN